MKVTYYQYGDSQLPLLYSDEELQALIDDYVNQQETFSYSQLCNHVLFSAKRESKIAMEQNTSYSRIVLTIYDSKRISKHLWELIWNMKIFITFASSFEKLRNVGETNFVRY